LSISELETEEDARAWANHPEHAAIQARGRSDYYESYVVYSRANARVRHFARSKPVGVRLPPSTVMRNISFRRPRYRSGPRQKCARTRHCLPSSMPTSAGELEDDHSQPQCESPGARKPHQLRCAVLHPCRMLRRNIDSQREDS